MDSDSDIELKKKSQLSKCKKVHLNFQNISKICDDGIGIYDIYQSELTKAYFIAGISKLSLAYNTNFLLENPNKVLLLLEQLQEEGWSKQKFNKALNIMIKSNKFKEWTIADFMSCDLKEVRLYPRSWMLKECQKNGFTEKNNFDIYDFPGWLLYKFKDGVELDPDLFPKWVASTMVITTNLDESYEKFKKEIENEILPDTQLDFEALKRKYNDKVKEIAFLSLTIKQLKNELETSERKNKNFAKVINQFTAKQKVVLNKH